MIILSQKTIDHEHHNIYYIICPDRSKQHTSNEWKDKHDHLCGGYSRVYLDWSINNVLLQDRYVSSIRGQ